MIIRMELTKGESVRYISHLDYANLLQRAIRRANLPAAYSNGFNPHMKLSFASALPLGMTAKNVYADLELTKDITEKDFFDALDKALLPGVTLLNAKILPAGKNETLASLANEATYKAQIPDISKEKLAKAIDDFNKDENLSYTRQKLVKSKKRKVKPQLVEKILLMKDYLLANLSLDEDGNIIMKIKVSQEGSIKPIEVLTVLRDKFIPEIDLENTILERIALTHNGENI